MSVLAVVYRYTDEHERGEEVRPTHRKFLDGLGEANLCAGPVGPDGDAGALLRYPADSREEALDPTEGGPFRAHGLIAHVQVRHGLTALGGLMPQFPEP